MAKSNKAVTKSNKAVTPGTVDADGFEAQETQGDMEQGVWVSAEAGAEFVGTLEKAFYVEQEDGSFTPAVAMRDPESEALLCLGIRAFYADPLSKARVGDTVKVKFDRKETLTNKKTGKPNGKTAWRGTFAVKRGDGGATIAELLKVAESKRSGGDVPF